MDLRRTEMETLVMRMSAMIQGVASIDLATQNTSKQGKCVVVVVVEDLVIFKFFKYHNSALILTFNEL